ncbi:quinon protein alcohol dehydrogenase-like superfamily [Chaetomium tenue]|uniref:Quinon protein alcohol dehydrogenase-like superfamily n=1 Tax=Chaetomium tenue TaxID=1854479 RepID=A0ACB7P943_9PEZI|nr:quinon protein alcohol dehydrogenase-like superfamily [Chaetomium globosum]
MLLCGIVDELRRSLRQEDRLSFFFCEAGNKNAESAAAVLRSIIYLLVSQQKTLISKVLQEYKKAGPKLFEGLGAWYALRGIFLSVLPELRREHTEDVTYFVIDALDECGEDLERLVSFISEASGLPGVKWLVTSSRRADVAKHLEVGEARLHQDLDDCTGELTQAINKYIDWHASKLAHGTKDDDLREQICRSLREKARATFRDVTLALAELKAVPTFRLLRSLYRQASDRIQHLDQETRHLCCRVLATVAIAHRPLSLNQSVKEFLSNDRGLFPNGLESEHRRVFMRSLALMEESLHRDMYSLYDFGLLAVDIEVPEPNPLGMVGYACEYWIEHLVASNYCGRDIRDGGALSAFLEMNPWTQTLALSGADLEVVGLVAFSADGAWLAAALKGDCNGKTVQKVRVWDMLTGNNVWTLENASSWVAFPPNHHLLLGTTTGPGEVGFWDLAKGAWNHYIINGLTTDATAFSPDGVWMASADRDCIFIWDWARGNCTLWFRHRWTSCPSSVAYSANGTRLASAHRKELRVWDAQTGSLLRCIDIADATLVAFSPDAAGDRLISASNESLAMWNAETGELVLKSTLSSRAVAISVDGSRLAVAHDGEITAMDSTWTHIRTIHDDNQHVRSLVLSPNGNQIASIGTSGLRLYAATSTDSKVLNVAGDHADKISLIRVSVDGNTAVSVSPGMIRIWDLTRSRRPRHIQEAHSGILDVALPPDGARLVSISSCQDAAIWDTETGTRLQTIPDYGFVASFSPNGADVALLTSTGKLKIWSLAHKKYTRVFEQPTLGKFGSGSVAFAPDGRIATSLGHVIRVWKMFHRLHTQTMVDDATAKALVFSSNGRQLAALYADKIKIWDPERGCCLQTLDVGRYCTNLAAFDAARSWLLTDVGLVLLDEAPAEDGNGRRELPRLRYQGYGVDVESGWVTWDSEKVLWLPLAYRPDSTAVILPTPEALTPSAIVLGCRSGRVVVLRFPTGLLPGLSG